MDKYEGILVEGGEFPPTADPAAPDAEETPLPAPVDAPAPPAESAPAPEDEPPVPRGIQRRIDTLTRRNYEYQRELDVLKGTVQALQQPAPPPALPAGEPREEDYTRHADYVAAMVDYRVGQKLAEASEAQEEQASRQMQQQTQAAQHAAIQAREAEVLTTHPDYYDRCAAVVQQLAPQVQWGLRMAGEHGPDLVLYLHDHPEAIPRLNQMPAHQIGIELGLLRASTGAPPGAGARQAHPKPEPPTPLAGGGRTSNPETYHENMPQAAYEAWRRKTSTLYRRPGA